jgi:hypothetical protein
MGTGVEVSAECRVAACAADGHRAVADTRSAGWLAWFIAAGYRRERTLLALVLALTLVHGLLYVALIPPWQAPDEPYHFLSAHSINLQELPDAPAHWQDLQRETIASLVQFRFWDFVVFVPAAHTEVEVYQNLPNGLTSPTPPDVRAFTYRFLALALRLVQEQDVTVQLFWARLCSVLVNVVLVGVAFVAGRVLFAGDVFGTWLLPLTVALMPTQTFMTATVNDGNPAELLVSMAVLWLVLAVVRGMRWEYLIAAGLFTLAGAAAKPTALFCVPVFGLVLLVHSWRKLPGWWRWLPPFAGLLVAFGVFSVSTRVQIVLRDVVRAMSGENATELGAGLTTLPFQRTPLEIISRFWADLGWHSLPVSDTWAWVFLAATALALVGCTRLAWRNVRRGACAGTDRALWHSAVLLGLCVVTDLVILTFASATKGVSYYSARYAMGAIIPIIGLLVIGWRELIPAGWRREGLVAMATFLFLFDLVVLTDYVLPFFYPLWR